MPVFYTNVTDIWTLTLKKRIGVNLGGIYFQLLLNLLFLTLAQINVFHFLFTALFVANTLSLLSALNPFFRYDGFWIYSDFFDLPNLKTHCILFFKKPLYYLKVKSKKQFYGLLIYSCLNTLFWGYIFKGLLKTLLSNFEYFISLLSKHNLTITQLLADIIFRFLISILLIFILANYFKNIFKKLFYEA